MLTATSPFIGSGLIALGAAPGVYARDLIWVDLRQAPGGLGTEASPFNTANLGFGALPDGGTLVLYGGDASSEPGVTVSSRSHTAWGLGSGVAGAGLPPVLPTLTYSTSVAQRLTYRNVSVALVHAGTTAGLTSVVFDGCPSATVSAGGDATTIYCRGDRSCTFSGSGGAAKFRGINLGAYTANGSNAIEIDGCNVTGSQTSSTSITITGDCAFGAISITAPTINIDPVSHRRAVLAGASFSVTPTWLLAFGSPSAIGTSASDGTALSVPHSDHVHQLTFTTWNAVAATANATINVNGQRITGLATPSSSTDAVTKAYADGLAVGLKVKTAAVVVATANQATLSGTAQTIDGVALGTIGQRVLLTAQSTATQNGLWTVQSGAWTRPADFATGSSAAQSYVPITSGTVGAGSSYFCTSSLGSDVVDTNNLTWTLFSAPASVSGGNGLVKSGTTLDVVPNADGTIVVNADDIQVGTLLTTNLGANIVTDAKLRTSAALSVIGRSANSTGNVADISGANNTVLRVSSSVLGFGAIDLSTAQVTGVLPAGNQASQTLAGDVGGTTAASVIGTNKVTNTMIRQSVGLSVIARSASTTGNVADVTGTNNTVLRVSGSVLGFGAIDLSTAQVTGTLPTANQAAQAHGSLTGLSGDDHTQYIRVDGTRAFAGDQSFGSHGATSLSFAGFGTGAPGAGFLRMSPAGSSQAQLMTTLASDGVTVVSLARWTQSTNQLRLGDGSTDYTKIVFKAGGTGFLISGAADEYAFNETGANWNFNSLNNVGYLDFYDGTNAVPSSGFIRAPYNVATIIKSKDAGGTDRDVLRVRSSTNPEITLGDTAAYDVWAHIKASSGSFGVWDGTSQLLKVTPSGTSLAVDLSMGTHGITHGASPASVGAERWSHGDFSAGKSSGGSDRNLVSWGIDGTDWLTFGHPSNATDLYTTGGSHIFNVASSTKLSVDANKLFIGTTGTAPTSNPAGGLYMWVAAAESLRTRSDTGVEEHLTHINGGSITGTTKQIIRRENNLTTFNGSRTVIDTYTLPDNTVALFEARITGRNATSAEQATYFVQRGAFRRGGGATLLGSDVLQNWETNAAWDVSFDVSSNDVRINVLGAAGQTIVWWVRWEITLFTP